MVIMQLCITRISSAAQPQPQPPRDNPPYTMTMTASQCKPIIQPYQKSRKDFTKDIASKCWKRNQRKNYHWSETTFWKSSKIPKDHSHLTKTTTKDNSQYDNLEQKVINIYFYIAWPTTSYKYRLIKNHTKNITITFTKK